MEAEHSTKFCKEYLIEKKSIIYRKQQPLYVFQIGQSVADRLLEINRECDEVLNLGCGLGQVARHIPEVGLTML